jgi:hypothetical protein
VIPNPNVSIKYDDTGILELDLELELELETVEISLFFIRVSFFTFVALLFNRLSLLE